MIFGQSKGSALNPTQLIVDIIGVGHYLNVHTILYVNFIVGYV